MTGTLIDNAFVDGLKNATGLETSIYADNQISATTLVSVDNKSRLIGIKEEDPKIKTQVLDKAESYTGSIDIINTPYFATYLPLLDVDDNPVGMLFVGKPQTEVLALAGQAIELTYLVVIALLILSLVPAYFVSRAIVKQLK